MIQSNKQIAEDIANKMGYASDSVSSAANKTYTKATGTTLTVNEKAQSANDELLKLTKQYNEAFLKTIEQLHSVVSEFERTDMELNNAIHKLLPFGFSTYSSRR